MNAALPRVMVAPNGARRTKADHPNLPITIDEIVDEAKACFEAGAEALHAHVRDENGMHSLDIDLYRELLDRMRWETPEMAVQVTTESADKYAPPVQRELLARLRPSAASVSIREMLSDGNRAAARSAYHGAREAGVAVQHIAYDKRDVASLKLAAEDGTLPSSQMQVLLVMGTYGTKRTARLEDLAPLLNLTANLLPEADYAVCAFGPEETALLRAVLGQGG